MKDYGWVILRDNIMNPKAPAPSNANAVGLTGPSDMPPGMTAEVIKRDGQAFRMYDDDGNLYYEGVLLGGGGFEPLEDFGAPNAGCTEIRMYDRASKKFVRL